MIMIIILMALPTTTSTTSPGNLKNIKIGENTEKSPGDLVRLAVTLNLVKAHQQRWFEKYARNNNNNNNNIGWKENSQERNGISLIAAENNALRTNYIKTKMIILNRIANVV